MSSSYLIIDRQGNGVDINNMHDKRKSCHGCPDRVADPNCHGTCQGYIDRAAESKQKSAMIRAEKARNAITYLPDGELHKRQKAISAARSWKKNKEGI
jgi:hypothetical protein